MSRENPINLRSRRSPERSQLFQPEDNPALWKLTRGPKGIGGLNDVPTDAVLNMFVPGSVRDQLPLRQDDMNTLDISESGKGAFRLHAEIEDHSFIELDAYIEPGTSEAPNMLYVSEYEADLQTDGGTQAFYDNLEYQLGHMNIPVIFGQKVPWSLGFFMHRVGQVPVALLADKFSHIQRRIHQLRGRSQEDMLTKFPEFSYTVQIYGQRPNEMVKPEYRESLAELQKLFDDMDITQRQDKYPTIVKRLFNLT